MTDACECTHWVQQSVPNLLPVAVAEARPTELTPHTHTLRVAAVGLGISSFLTALVASGTLERIMEGKKTILWICQLLWSQLVHAIKMNSSKSMVEND